MVKTLISGDGDESFDRQEAAEFDSIVQFHELDARYNRDEFKRIVAPYAGSAVVEQAMRLPATVRQAERAGRTLFRLQHFN